MNSVYYDDVHRGRVAGPIGGFHSNERGRLQRFHRYLQRDRTAHHWNGAHRDECATKRQLHGHYRARNGAALPNRINGDWALQDVTVTDTRNFYPGWAVHGREANFVGSGAAAGSTISGNQLGWTPTAVGSLVDGATLGPTVAPESPGLGSTPGRLAF